MDLSDKAFITQAEEAGRKLMYGTTIPALWLDYCIGAASLIYERVTDKAGAPYIQHFIQVVRKLFEMDVDPIDEPEYYCAAALHDLKEDFGDFQLMFVCGHMGDYGKKDTC